MLVDVNVLGTTFEVECEMEGINSSTLIDLVEPSIGDAEGTPAVTDFRVSIITIFHHGVNMTDMLNDSTIKLIENTLEEYHG